VKKSCKKTTEISTILKPSTEVTLAPADEEVVERKVDALNPIDPNMFIKDGFRDALFRSQEVRDTMWSIAPKAETKLKEILDLPTVDEKTLSTQFAAAKFVIESNLVKFPDISHKTVEIKDTRNPNDLKQFKPVTRQEVIDATVIAIEAENHRGEGEDEEASGGVGEGG